MIAVLLAAAVSQGALASPVPTSAVEIAAKERLAATPTLLAQYFEPPRRVGFEPCVSWYRRAISADGTALYFIGDNAAGIYLLRHSLATGKVTVGPKVSVHGDLYTLPNNPDEMLVTWQRGGASGPYGAGFIDLRSGRIEPLAVCGSPYPQGAFSRAGIPDSAECRPVSDEESFSTGEVLVAQSGRFLAVAGIPSAGGCYLPEYVVFNTATHECEYRFFPSKAGTHENQVQGEVAEAGSGGCDDTWEAFWHDGDILRIYRLRSNGYKAMFELSRDSTGEWRSSGERPVYRITEVRGSRSLSPRDRRLVLSRDADGPAFEIDPRIFFPGREGGLSVVYGPCCVVLLHPVKQSGTLGKGIEAVILRWKDQAVPLEK
jgi:hypothetical protein